MAAIVPVCLAGFFLINAVALLAVGIVAYLYWLGFQEKRARRQHDRWLESKRREIKARAETKPATPPQA